MEHYGTDSAIPDVPKFPPKERWEWQPRCTPSCYGEDNRDMPDGPIRVQKHELPGGKPGMYHMDHPEED
jgi:hypothetical protein